MNSICLYGAGGHSKVVKDILESNEIKIKAFIDDNAHQKYLHKIPVLEPSEISELRNSKFIICIGNNVKRKSISENLNVGFAVAIHQQTVVSKTASIDEGSVVMPGVHINSDVSIGKHVIINTSSVIEHDCVLGDFVHVSPSVTITGNVSVGEGTHIGAGAVIIPNVKIGKWAVIGAGSVILKDVPDYAVVVGNPGKIIKNHS